MIMICYQNILVSIFGLLCLYIIVQVFRLDRNSDKISYFKNDINNLLKKHGASIECYNPGRDDSPSELQWRIVGTDFDIISYSIKANKIIKRFLKSGSLPRGRYEGIKKVKTIEDF